MSRTWEGRCFRTAEMATLVAATLAVATAASVAYLATRVARGAR